MACDTRVELQGIPPELQLKLNIGGTSAVTFVRIEEGFYHDGVRFPDDTEVTLQRLGSGVIADTIDTLTTPSMPERHYDLEMATESPAA